MDNIVNPLSLFLPYQLKYIQDDSKYLVCEKSRRIGISFAEAFRAVYQMHQEIHQGKRVNYNYVAQTELSAKTFAESCLKFTVIFNEICRVAGFKPICDIRKVTMEKIPFINGASIKIFSSNPDGLRGQGGHLCLDEAAFAPDGDELEKAAYPVVNTIGLDCKLRIISTHNGYGTFFNRTINDVVSGKKQRWSHHKITIHDAVEQGMALKSPGDHMALLPDLAACNKLYLDQLKGNYSDIAWQQEFECKPVSSGLMMVSDQDYTKLAIASGTEVPLDPNKKYNNLYVGVDPGINDQTIIWVTEERYNNSVADANMRREFFTRYVQVLKGVRTQDLQQMIKNVIDHPNVVMAYIDKGAFGLTIYEYLQKSTGKVMGISFSAPQKKILAEQVRKYVSQERVSLPKDRNDIREDVCCVQLIASDAGNISYGGRSSFGHGDAFWALSLALQAAEDNPGAFAKGVVR